MRAFDAVLFDVDGTLLHSRPGILNTFAYAFRQMGLDQIREQELLKGHNECEGKAGCQG